VTSARCEQIRRRVGVGLLWTVAISRLVTTTTAIVAERPLVPPPEPAEPDDPLVVPDDPLAAPAPQAAPDSWRTELRSTTWILVGATLVFSPSLPRCSRG